MIIPDVPALKMCRTKQGLSARALALKASLNVSTVAGIEKTGHPVSPATAKAVCDVLNVPFEALFTLKTEYGYEQLCHFPSAGDGFGQRYFPAG